MIENLYAKHNGGKKINVTRTFECSPRNTPGRRESNRSFCTQASKTNGVGGYLKQQ